MTAVAIIQARMSSSRLPGKVLKPLAGKPMIWHIYQRARRCSLVEDIIVATSTQTSDDQLANFCHQEGLQCFRGPLNNVLARFLSIRPQYPRTKYVARITGDCPLIHPELIDNQIMALQRFDADLSWIEKENTSLVGQGTHSWASLEYIKNHSSDPRDLEHVGSPYISNHPEAFKIVEMKVPETICTKNVRITIDEPEDYQLMSKLFDALWDETEWIELTDALAWLTENQKIAAVNSLVKESTINQEVQERMNRWKNVPKAGLWEYRHA